ncbi:hypothetical protein O3M35_003378 [Rhynocoris fuscipes]|uniref:Tesmin/TSO1-like CXC domain-containing protein n=1 Tax=Rhynocoris fuscipes TaxID=488301 RepID=A0AAW1CJX7_9HEMI
MSSRKDKPLKSALKKKGNEKKKKKNSVTFGQVDIFHFNRAQGFTAVPSSGGYTLGMKKKHFREETLSVDDHNHGKNIKRLIEEKRRANREDSQISSLNVDISDVRLITEDERVNMLLRAGVKLDHSEKLECEYIQISRMKNGCECTEICVKNSCSCWKSGINCQVDRFNYPCGCSTRGCKNPYGRNNYKTERIQDHFVRTISRLSLHDDDGGNDNHRNNNDQYNNDDSKRTYTARVRRS